MSSRPSANLEIVNRTVNPVFSNTVDGDFVVFTDTSDQNIHFGCDSNATSVLQVTKSNVNIVGDINIKGNVLQDGKMFQSGIAGLSNSTGAIFVQSGSNFGIGVTNPQSLLHVAGVASIDGDINVKGSILQNGKLFQSGIAGLSNNIGNVYVQSGSNFGVGLSSPQSLLHVAGIATIDGDINVKGNILQNGIVFQSGITGLSNNPGNVYVQSGSNFGIGVTNPQSLLHVAGVASIDGDINVKGSILQNGQLFQSGITGLSNNIGNVYVQSGSNFGIGVTNPQSLLHVAGVASIDGDINVKGNILQDGKIFKSDVVGLSNNKGNVYVQSGSNFGIGMSNPQSLLHVAGSARIDGDLALSNKKLLFSSILLKRRTENGVNNITSTMGAEGLANNIGNVYVQSGSNFGIGIQTPQSLLHVAGSARIDGDLILPNKKLLFSSILLKRRTENGVNGITSTPGIITTGQTSIDFTLSNAQRQFTFIDAWNSNMLVVTDSNIGTNKQIWANSNDNVALPSYTWAGDNNTGMYRVANGSIGFSTANKQTMRLDNGGVNITGNLNITSGTIYVDNVQFQGSGGNATVQGISSTLSNINILSGSNLKVINGQIITSSNDSTDAPSYTWSNDINTGMYHIAQNAIGFVSSGRQVFSLSNDTATIGGITVNTSSTQATTISAYEFVSNKDVELYGNARVSTEKIYEDPIVTIPGGAGNFSLFSNSTYNFPLGTVTGGSTFECYVRLLNVSQKQTIAASQAPSTSYSDWELYVASSGKIEFSYFDGTAVKIYTGSQVLLTNTWYHLALTFDQSTTRGRLFVNGSLDATWLYNTNQGMVAYYLPLLIGNQQPFTTLLSTTPFNWYDAHAILPSSTNILDLADLSGNSRPLSQSTTTAQPTYILSGINNHPAINFNGVNGKYLVCTGPGSAVSQFTMAMVVRTGTLGTRLDHIISTQGDWTLGSKQFAMRITNYGTSLWALDTFLSVSGAAQYTVSFSPQSNTPYIIIFTFNSGVGRVYINGTAYNSFTFNSTTANIATLNIGAVNVYTDRTWGGMMGELMIFNTALGSTDLSKIEAYLASKWWSAAANPLPSTHSYKTLSVQSALTSPDGWYNLANAIGQTTVQNDTASSFDIGKIRLTKQGIIYPTSSTSIGQTIFTSPLQALNVATTGTTLLLAWKNRNATTSTNTSYGKLNVYGSVTTSLVRSPYLNSCFSIDKTLNVAVNGSFTVNIASLQGYANLVLATLTNCCPQGSGILTISPYFSTTGGPAYYYKYVCHLSYSVEQTTNGAGTTYTYTTNTISGNNGLTVATSLTASTSAQLTVTNATTIPIIGYIATFANIGPPGW